MSHISWSHSSIRCVPRATYISWSRSSVRFVPRAASFLGRPLHETPLVTAHKSPVAFLGTLRSPRGGARLRAAHVAPTGDRPYPPADGLDYVALIPGGRTARRESR